MGQLWRWLNTCSEDVFAHLALQAIADYELSLSVACALEVPHQTCLISCSKNYPQY